MAKVNPSSATINQPKIQPPRSVVAACDAASSLFIWIIFWWINFVPKPNAYIDMFMKVYIVRIFECWAPNEPNRPALNLFIRPVNCFRLNVITRTDWERATSRCILVRVNQQFGGPKIACRVWRVCTNIASVFHVSIFSLFAIRFQSSNKRTIYRNRNKMNRFEGCTWLCTWKVRHHPLTWKAKNRAFWNDERSCRSSNVQLLSIPLRR